MTRGGRAAVAWLLVVAAALGVAACGGGAAEPQGTAVADQGAQVYASTCAACHGPQGEGTDAGPPLIHPYYEPGHHDDATFHRAITTGVAPHHWEFGPMPAQRQLDEEQVAAVIAHVRQLQREAGLIP